ncbi:LOW QUALITY PROTEIN: hypothetical protein MAR_014641 [Mya arenaria]|uniref:Uncharacterized protein n=1 Tax=Mya arenaria TaxID=6604 RepID=A0ABY7FI02_MYAAR|nr:LOW QUALITY PROTEIN: hypothetical protein MAR_014641 [Mya arenaria]
MGKASALKELVINADLQIVACQSDKDVGQLDERAIVIDPCLSLDILRYQTFTMKVLTGKSFVQVHTSDAAFFHIQRVYFQTQICIRNTMLKF